MTTQLTTVVCSEHEKLREEAKGARDIWEERRAEICCSQLVGKETGDELLCLQAKYARVYLLLQKHMNECGQCRLVSKIA